MHCTRRPAQLLARSLAQPLARTARSSPPHLAVPHPRSFSSSSVQLGVRAAPRPARLTKAKPLPPGAPKTELFELCRSIPALRARPTLINEDSAREIVRDWGVHEMQDVTVVDSYAGAVERTHFLRGGRD